MTARASDSMFLRIDFVRVTNCFYDYDYTGTVAAYQYGAGDDNPPGDRQRNSRGERITDDVQVYVFA